MAVTRAPTVRIGVELTLDQLREVDRRAGVDGITGKGRSAYIVGALFGEPQAELLDRVRRVSDSERARLRAELQAERAQRSASTAAV